MTAPYLFLSLMPDLALVETRQTRYANKARETRFYWPDSHQ